MYVCVCKGVTDREIEQRAIQGDDYSDVRRELGVATDCGACGQLCKSLLRQYEAEAVASAEFSTA